MIADDYIQIWLGRNYGPVSGWAELARDPLYRCRATSLLLTYWTEQIFGFNPFVFNATSLALHILSTWLVLALGAWRVIGWKVAALAAAFFAISQRHHEAVIWYAALPELLVFFFGMQCLLWWVLWLQSSGNGRRYYILALVAFLLALASKESAVVVVPLLLLPLWFGQIPVRRWLAPLAPFAGLALLYTVSIFAAQQEHLHFHDGSFSMEAPFLITWVNSFARLFRTWGLLSLVALLFWRVRRPAPVVWIALAWVAITLLPYSFLLYMPRVPSRHTYFASAGLALVVAAGFLLFHERFQGSRPWAPLALSALILLHNCGYLWIRKQPQFLERAAPTEALLHFAGKVKGPVYVHYFPYGFEVAQHAVELAIGPPSYVLPWQPGLHKSVAEPDVFCWGKLPSSGKCAAHPY